MFYQTLKGVYTPNLFQKFFVLHETIIKCIFRPPIFQSIHLDGGFTL